MPGALRQAEGLSPPPHDPIPARMDNPALARLETAIDRLDRALDSHRAAAAALSQRHARLKAHMTDAVAALDQVIARGGTD